MELLKTAVPREGGFPRKGSSTYPVVEPAQGLQGADVLTGDSELEGPAQDVLGLTAVKGSRDLALHGLEQRIPWGRARGTAHGAHQPLRRPPSAAPVPEQGALQAFLPKQPQHWLAAEHRYLCQWSQVGCWPSWAWQRLAVHKKEVFGQDRCHMELE